MCKKWHFLLPLNAVLFGDLGAVSLKFRQLFGPEKAVVKLQSVCFEKLIAFNVRKTKRIVKFDGLETRRVAGYKGDCRTRKRPEKFRDF